MNYSYLKKCRGTCLKGKDVSLTNCIGVNPHHEECQYRKRNGFQKAGCPYYNPLEEEKNYSQDFDEIIGERYYRRPFRIIMFYAIASFTILFLWSIFTQRFIGGDILFLINSSIGYMIFFSVITFIGNKFFYKNRFLVSVINEQGIYTRQRFISWDEIAKVKSHYRIIGGGYIKRSVPAYLVELELRVKLNKWADVENIYDIESIYIYFSTLEMRMKIRKYLKEDKG